VISTAISFFISSIPLAMVWLSENLLRAPRSSWRNC
jgi:hypothetical protein